LKAIKEEDGIIVKREVFSSGLAVFFATLGSAVGLGNIWKFPYLAGANGGGAFLFVYLICVVFVGLPVMISEFYIGRKTRKNVLGAIKELKKDSKLWRGIALFGILSNCLILFFYSSVGGWVYSYVFKAFSGSFKNITTETAAQTFMSTIVNPIPPILWQVAVVLVVSSVILAGVQKGIEKITKTLMPVFFILILICFIRALSLPGAAEGVKFLFHVDFAKITPTVILTALGLAFFKLSVGMGTMVTYASYFTKDNNMVNTSVRVALSDTIVSILAGLAIFPAVFSFGMQADQGPGLLFITIPMVFSKIYLGNILLILFFILASIAATTAMISMMQVPVAYLVEEKNFSRKKSVIFVAMITVIIGSLATLSADSSSVLSGIKVFGYGFFDLFDKLSSNLLLPLGGLLITLFAAYVVKKDSVVSELTNDGTLNNISAVKLFYFILRYITPVLVFIVFLNSIGILKI
jgi:neurotransmitter:Na+ symporter, NSS family